MSELPPDEANPDFPLVIQPELEITFDLARKYQEEFDANPFVDEARKAEVIVDLNQAWRPYYNQFVLASGKIRTPVYELLEGEDSSEEGKGSVTVAVKFSNEETVEYEDVTVEDTELLSEGFTIVNEPVYAGGHLAYHRPVIKLVFGRVHEVFSEDGVDCKEINDQVTCLPNEIALEFEIDSPGICEGICHDYFPDVAEDLQNLAELDRLTLAQRLLALREKIIPVESYITTRELEALSRYAYDTLMLEEEAMPFWIRVNDGTLVFEREDEDNSPVYDLDAMSFLVQIRDIYPRPLVTVTKEQAGGYKIDSNPQFLEFRVELRMINAKPDDDIHTKEICLKDVSGLLNIRDQLAAQADDVELTDD